MLSTGGQVEISPPVSTNGTTTLSKNEPTGGQMEIVPRKWVNVTLELQNIELMEFMRTDGNSPRRLCEQDYNSSEEFIY